MTTTERRPPSPSGPGREPGPRRVPLPAGRAGRLPAPTCHACGRRVPPGPGGALRIVGVAPREAPRVWVWGPVLVHEDCRYDVRTPFDDETGYVPVDQVITGS